MPNPTALTQRLPRRDASISHHTISTLHWHFCTHFTIFQQSLLTLDKQLHHFRGDVQVAVQHERQRLHVRRVQMDQLQARAAARLSLACWAALRLSSLSAAQPPHSRNVVSAAASAWSAGPMSSDSPLAMLHSESLELHVAAADLMVRQRLSTVEDMWLSRGHDELLQFAQVHQQPHLRPSTCA